jgi:ribosomal protein L23
MATDIPAPAAPARACCAPHQVILRPLVTEKGMHRSTRHNAYAFEVSKAGHEGRRAQGVEELFNVKVFAFIRRTARESRVARGSSGTRGTGRRRSSSCTRSIGSTSSNRAWAVFRPTQRRQDARKHSLKVNSHGYSTIQTGDTAWRRGATVSDFAELTKGAKPEKNLLVRKKKTGGRNNQGASPPGIAAAVTSAVSLIDFVATRTALRPGADSIKYDPNRSARIALLHYVDGEKRYILAPAGLKAGDQIESGPMHRRPLATACR